jgi:hypothetical protein
MVSPDHLTGLIVDEDLTVAAPHTHVRDDSPEHTPPFPDRDRTNSVMMGIDREAPTGDVHSLIAREPSFEYVAHPALQPSQDSVRHCEDASIETR